jgi:hypothetical protein
MTEKPQPARWLKRNVAGRALASFFSDLAKLIPGVLAALALPCSTTPITRSCLRLHSG